MRIYIAGPYTNETARGVQANVNRAISAACALIRKGHNPYVPHLTHFIWLHPEGDFPYETWTKLDMEWLKLCEGFLYLAPSKGADKELEMARGLGLPVWYSVSDVPSGLPDVATGTRSIAYRP